MFGGKTATVPRRGHHTKTVATPRSKLTVRLVELLYPLPANDTSAPYVREIVNKWIYCFYQPGESGAGSVFHNGNTRYPSWEKSLNEISRARYLGPLCSWMCAIDESLSSMASS